MRMSMIYWNFYFLLPFLILLSHPIRGENVSCPFNSACECIPTIPPGPDRFQAIDCSGPSIPAITARPNASYIVRTLRLHTDLSKIPAGYFSAFQSIDSLVLEHTGHGNQQWNDRAFDRVLIKRTVMISGLNGVLPPAVALQQVGQKGLKRLLIQGDRSGRLVSDTFKNFSKLETLSINNSIVQILDGKAFSGLEQSLQDLEILDTPLPRFPPIENLGKLNRLVLRNNTIKEIPKKAFSNLRDLTELSLDYNDLGSGSAFDSLPLNLSELSLKGIGLKSIPNSLVRLGARTLNLAENQIKEVGSKDFSGNINLEEINLNKNPVSKIENGAFERLEAPTVIKLEETALTSLDVAICDHVSDCNIHATKNGNLKRLLASEMKKVPSSLTIWLRDSGLESIDQKLADVMNQTRNFLLEISANRKLRCNDLKWMAPIYVCQTHYIVASEASCADKSVGFDAFMNGLFAKAKCPKVPTTPPHPCVTMTC